MSNYTNTYNINQNNESESIVSSLSSDIPSKFKYSIGEEFTFQGKDYIGYFNIVNGIPYVGRDKQEEVLISKKNISSIVEISGDYFDRIKTDDFTSKINLEDVLFEPNEIINKNSINTKIELLYDNFKELFKFSKMSDPVLPNNFTAFASITAVDLIRTSPSAAPTSFKPVLNWTSGDDLILSTNDTVNDLKLESFNPVLSDERKLFKILQGPLSNKLTLFLACSNTIFSFDLDKTDKQVLSTNTFTFINSTNKVGLFENYNFKDIVSIDSNGENTLYISDSGNNSIFELEVDTIVNRDRTGNRNYLLTKVIGNSGTDDTNFSLVDDIVYADELVFVYDKNTKIIKKFTKNLNFISKYENIKYFKENDFLNINYNKNDRNLYILSRNFNVLVLSVDNFEKIDEFKLDGNEVKSQYPVKLVFSRNNSNIYYLLTNGGIHKYLLNRKNKVIGSFFVRKDFETVEHWETTFIDFSATAAGFWDNFPINTNFVGRDIELLESEFNFDRIYALNNNSFLEFLEDNDYRTFLNNESPTFINLEDMLLSDEYFNNITFNNLIYKYLHNINILGNNLNEKIDLAYKQSVLSVDKFIALDPESKVNNLKINNIKDFYVGMNETVSTIVFNRVFKNLYNYQTKIASLINSRVTNTEISPLTTITF